MINKPYPDFQESDILSIYTECGLANELSFEIFEIAMNGLKNIGAVKNNRVITIVDYSRSSSLERFYVIDIIKNKILFKTLVAHGKNSGEITPEYFSNLRDSQQSSLGFFLTAETYNGKHGYSLSLDGIEPGINDNARTRSIVIHGADYVSLDFIKEYGRLGRSWGCPALPSYLTKEIIDTIAGGSCLFIYGIDPEYLKNSKIVNCK